jgi:NhaA family Na+:H+ antiporter
MWFALHEAGVHPTIAGVVMGLLAPAVTYREKPLIDWLQHALHPVSSYVVVPIFALANGGISVSLDGLRDAAASPVTWGVGVGLVVGKPLGIVFATLLAVRLRVADMPLAASLRQLIGTGVAAGIGFTVAIFIAELALVDAADQANAKLAILLASLAAAALGLLLLCRGAARSPAA